MKNLRIDPFFTLIEKRFILKFFYVFSTIEFLVYCLLRLNNLYRADPNYRRGMAIIKGS